MSFNQYSGGLLYIAAAILLVVFLVRGIGLPGQQKARLTTVPLRFTAYASVCLGFILLQAHLLYTDHPLAQNGLGLLVSAFGMLGALNPGTPARAQPSRSAFAEAPEPPSVNWVIFTLWAALGFLWLAAAAWDVFHDPSLLRG